jgi:SAM-dependent methyltransferase
VREGDHLVSSGARYPIVGGVPDLRVAPSRLSVDLPWVDVSDSVAIESGAFEYLPNFAFPPDVHPLVHSLVDLDGRGRTIVDVGCGIRNVEEFFLSRGFRYVGVDYERRGVGPDLLVDAHRMPFRDGAIDMYYSNSVYEHLTSPLIAALEGRRVLRKGGVFWGSTAFMYGFHDHASYHHMSHAGVLLLLRQAGFTKIRLLPGLDYPAAIAASAFGRNSGARPWTVATRLFLRLMDASYLATSNGVRRLVGKRRIDRRTRKLHLSGGVGFSALAE